MTDDAKIKQFVNDVYMTKFNRRVDTLTDAVPDDDAVEEVFKVCRWASMFATELENERDYEGRIMNWDFLRYYDVDLGTIATANQSITIPTDYLRLVVHPNRPLTINQDTTRLATFKVVDGNQITKRLDTWTGDRVTQTRNTLYFSRPFKSTEFTSHVIADLLKPVPRMTPTSALMLDTVPYYELLVLGVAKNATLPGIVEGGLSPSLAQKYNDLLDGAKADSANTSIADDAWDENDSSYIGMI